MSGDQLIQRLYLKRKCYESTRKLIAPRADVPVSCHKITPTRFDSRSPLRIAGCDLVHPNRIAYFVVLFEFIIFIFIIMVNFFSGQL